MAMAGIKDIAKLAGVSIGTVDRVLHNRGRCSEASRHKVEAAVRELNYKPNLAARQLKKGKRCRLAMIQPTREQDHGYWLNAEQGMEEAQKRMASFGVEVDLLVYDRHNTSSFTQLCSRFDSQRYDGILMTPLLPNESIHFLESHSHMPTVLYDCPLEGFKVLQSIFQSGTIAGQTMADLVKLMPKQQRVAAIGYHSPHPYIQTRLEAFQQQCAQNYTLQVDQFYISDHLNLHELEAHLASERIDLSIYDTIFVAKSGAYKYAQLLKASHPNIRLLGYDITPSNISALKNGELDVLVSQNCFRQVQMAIKTLVDYILYDKRPDHEHFKIPVELITPSNLVSHLEYRSGL